MASNSIGSLYIDIAARTASLEASVAKVRTVLAGIQTDTNNIASSSSGLDRLAGSFGRVNLGAMLLRDAFKAVISEVAGVVESIEKVQGVSPETLTNVQAFRANIQDANNGFKVLVADVVSGGVKMAQTIVEMGDSLRDYGLGGVLQGKTSNIGAPSIPSATDTARSADSGYDDKENTALQKQVDLRKQLNDVTIDSAQKIKDLMAAEQAEQAYQSDTNDHSSLQTTESENRAMQDQIGIKKGMLELQKQYEAAEAAYAKSLEKTNAITESAYTKMKAAQAQIKTLNNEPMPTVTGGAFGVGDPTQADPQLIEQSTKLLQQKTKAQTDLTAALKQYGDLAKQLGDATASDLVKGIESGEKMHTILTTLATDVIKLIVQQEIEKPLASMFTSGFSSAIGAVVGAFATGGPYVNNKPFIAGENGPELINPGNQSGTVLNPSQTSQALGRSGSSNNMNFNQSFNIGDGVSKAELAGIIPSIVQQARSAVSDGVRRGGAYRQVFSQA